MEGARRANGGMDHLGTFGSAFFRRVQTRQTLLYCLALEIVSATDIPPSSLFYSSIEPSASQDACQINWVCGNLART